MSALQVCALIVDLYDNISQFINKKTPVAPYQSEIYRSTGCRSEKCRQAPKLKIKEENIGSTGSTQWSVGPATSRSYLTFGIFYMISYLSTTNLYLQECRNIFIHYLETTYWRPKKQIMLLWSLQVHYHYKLRFYKLQEDS